MKNKKNMRKSKNNNLKNKKITNNKNKRITNEKKIINNKRKKRKLKVSRIILFLLIVLLLFFIIKSVFKFPIKNIYISGNSYIKDQEIIDIAHISDYPSIFKYTNKYIKRNLEKNEYIKNATIKKKKLSEIYIKIDENIPIFYNLKTKKTIMSDKRELEKQLDCPILINYVPDRVYKKLIEKMSLVNEDIIKRISEIKYDPSNVDEERFLFSMNDGNYVYITLEKLDNINNYVEISLEIINKFGKKDGILNLDAGEYFEIISD